MLSFMPLLNTDYGGMATLDVKAFLLRNFPSFMLRPSPRDCASLHSRFAIKLARSPRSIRKRTGDEARRAFM